VAPEYAWLEKIGDLPNVIDIALKEIGVTEDPGKANDPEIMSWAQEVGSSAIGWKYNADEIPWCGLFVAMVIKRAKKTPLPKGPLYALNWATYGNRTHYSVLGDILVFKRNGGGHVGFYIGQDESAYHVLGGNQSDRVCITRISKSRLYQVRRPPFKYKLPESAKKYHLAATGKISKNET
jgi:uncharacterized protein (TIGR02594 family)